MKISAILLFLWMEAGSASLLSGVQSTRQRPAEKGGIDCVKIENDDKIELSSTEAGQLGRNIGKGFIFVRKSGTRSFGSLASRLHQMQPSSPFDFDCEFMKMVERVFAQPFVTQVLCIQWKNCEGSVIKSGKGWPDRIVAEMLDEDGQLLKVSSYTDYAEPGPPRLVLSIWDSRIRQAEISATKLSEVLSHLSDFAVPGWLVQRIILKINHSSKRDLSLDVKLPAEFTEVLATRQQLLEFEFETESQRSSERYSERDNIWVEFLQNEDGVMAQWVSPSKSQVIFKTKALMDAGCERLELFGAKSLGPGLYLPQSLLREILFQLSGAMVPESVANMFEKWLTQGDSSALNVSVPLDFDFQILQLSYRSSSKVDQPHSLSAKR